MFSRKEFEKIAQILLCRDTNNINSASNAFSLNFKGQLKKTKYKYLVVILFLILLVFYNNFFLVFVPFLFLYGYLKDRQKNIIKNLDFERDYVPFLISLISSIKTGLDPFMAFCECGKLFPENSILRHEITLVEEYVEKGASEDDAIKKFAVFIDHPDLFLFRTTFILARREGASLATSLQRLVKVTRQRQSFRRKIRAALAMQRLSAIGITACAILIALIQAVTNYQILVTAWHNSTGFIAILLGCLLIIFGLIWTLYLARRRI